MNSEYEEGDIAQRVEEFVQRTEEVFLNAIRKNPKISRKELLKMLMVSVDGVKYQLKKLKNRKLIEYVGYFARRILESKMTFGVVLGY